MPVTRLLQKDNEVVANQVADPTKKWLKNFWLVNHSTFMRKVWLELMQVDHPTHIKLIHYISSI